MGASAAPSGRVWDVVVAGAGPGGSVLATLLAGEGLRVLVLEKEEFPRFRIGESLLPMCLPVLARCGVQTDPDVFVFKRGAAFVCEDSGRTEFFPFSAAMEGCPEHAWHVDRARFDLLLRDRARAAGAEVRHGVTLDRVDLDAGELVEVESTTGLERTRYFVDATGQNRLLARRKQGIHPYRAFGRAACFTHFDDVGNAYDDVFGEHGDIRIMVRRDGWGWIIPLPHRRISIGIVSREKVGPAELDGGLLAGPLASRLLRGAQRRDTRIVGNFSYRNAAPSGARHGTVGDAYAFIDPLFSSGVTLAMRGANDLADELLAAFRDGHEAAPDLLAAHAARMDRACGTFAALIYRFYSRGLAGSFFLRGMPEYGLRHGIMSVLAGDVWRQDNPFQDMLLRSRPLTADTAPSTEADAYEIATAPRGAAVRETG